MRAQRLGQWLLVLSLMSLIVACRTAPLPPASSATPSLTPITMFEVKSLPDSAPTPDGPTSGVRLTANIDGECPGTVKSNAGCMQPYAGEFVITALNGE